MNRVNNSNRIGFIDAYRGLTLISMMLFHLMWDLASFGIGNAAAILESRGAFIWQQSICISFILISGFCVQFGRNRIKRSLMVLAGGVVITIVTCLLLYEDRDIFGVLWLLGTAGLLIIPIERIHKWTMDIHCKKSHAVRIIYGMSGMIIALALFIVFREVNHGYLGYGEHVLLELPQGLYRGYFMTFLGFKDPNFFSTDYFSILPWFFLYLAGFYLGTLVNLKKAPRLLKDFRLPLVNILGRYSFWVYMVHQVVLYGIVYLIYMIKVG